MHDVDIAKGVKIASATDSVRMVKNKIRESQIDHKKFNLFLDS
jgi:hypothetical protein